MDQVTRHRVASQAQLVLARYHLTILDDLGVDGASAAVWKALTPTGEVVVVKACNPDFTLGDEARASTLWHQLGVGAPKSWVLEPGVLVMEYVAGTPMNAVTSDELLQRTGRLLARMHEASSRGFDSIDELLVKWHERTVTEPSFPAEVIPMVQDSFQRLRRTPTVLLHGDFYCSNVLVDSDDTPVPIDGYGLTGPAAFDLAHFVASWPAAGEHDRVLSLLLDGYGSTPPGLDDYLDWLAAVRYVNALHWAPALAPVRLTYLQQRYAQQLSVTPSR